MNRTRFFLLCAVILPATACAPETAETAPHSATASAPQGVVDSVFPVEESLRRFRASLAHEALALEDAAGSRDELVQRFVDALEAADRDALVRLVLNRAEFGHRYYEHTRFTRPPYELAPEILWFQIQNRSGRGLHRLLERLGGRPLGFQGYSCNPDPEAEGPNRIWTDCVLRITDLRGDTDEARLFGAIVERDGSFKFVSYANEL
jgi:hypothetical protein